MAKAARAEVFGAGLKSAFQRGALVDDEGPEEMNAFSDGEIAHGIKSNRNGQINEKAGAIRKGAPLNRTKFLMVRDYPDLISHRGLPFRLRKLGIRGHQLQKC